MFLFLISSGLSDPNNKCSSQSNGNLGYVRYYEDDSDKKAVTSFYTEHHNSYPWKWVSRSICPRTTGTYTIKAQGFPSVHAFFNYQEKSEDGSVFTYRCTTTKTVQYENQYLYANRCYPLLIREKNNCVSGDDATGYINGKVIDNTTAINIFYFQNYL
ncbi:hypothetical protein TVAG_235460 [Trichomonas vaginalis G3]|uniref:Uncharacterized protein n=1 Tax=Trichomonas vaginalis (strain ATCC PRA-98 / G3) TaxID=412133 RepID=A2DPR4_TRIV3|nr:hypothetical protein TVAGG3_0934610 [Trichomonas vaginalis G3]EAY17664.1 hypothetical protein TVAG_235460 [Trichomonas vaginalis G3]KAI5486083.1 hypothetical protein TVAGG3_0934610 [Trichomonas vaginalis G3]|eukprot:XP_001329799.1 hypothetical protein [Trichomonas vaginalis G3]